MNNNILDHISRVGRMASSGSKGRLIENEKLKIRRFHHRGEFAYPDHPWSGILRKVSK